MQLWPGEKCSSRKLRPGRGNSLPAHAVKSIAEAMLSGMTNVEAGRDKGAAFAPLFSDDTIRTGRKVHNPRSGGWLSRQHRCKEARENDEAHSHIFPHT
jgi:hypothetical protein